MLLVLALLYCTASLASKCERVGSFPLINATGMFKISKDALYVLSSERSMIRMDRNGKVLGQWGGSNASMLAETVDFDIDEENNRMILLQSVSVDVYELLPVSNAPKFLFSFGKWAYLPTRGTFGNPVTLTVDRTNSNILVGDQVHANVQLFDSDGKFLKFIGLDFGMWSTPTGLVIDTKGTVTGVDMNQFEMIQVQANGASKIWSVSCNCTISSLATDAQGLFYVSASSLQSPYTDEVLVYSSAMIFLYSFGQDDLPTSGFSPSQLHFDPISGLLYTISLENHVLLTYKC